MSERDITDLWSKGKLWEIFGFTDNKFTALELTRAYAESSKQTLNSDEKNIINDAYRILNAPLTRQVYHGCRILINNIRRQIGEENFRNKELDIWKDIWDWTSKKWKPLPNELFKELCNVYSSVDDTEINNRLLKAFNFSKCSLCREFYKSRLSCPLDKTSWECIHYDRISKDEREELLSNEDWHGKILGVLKSVIEKGLVAKCRSCGGMDFNSNEHDCWNCDQNTLSCPECNELLRYDIQNETWKCSNTECGKQYAFRQKGESRKSRRDELVCPNCSSTLTYDEKSSLWKCQNQSCKRVYTQKDLSDKSRVKKQKPPDETTYDGKVKKKSRKALGLGLGLGLTTLIVLLVLLKPWQTPAVSGPTPEANPTPPTDIEPVEPLPVEPTPIEPVEPLPVEPTPFVEPPKPVEPPDYSTPPNDSYVKWNDNSDWTLYGDIEIDGDVRNTNTEWSMSSVEIEVLLYDENEYYLSSRYVNVANEIGPNDRVSYSETIYPPESCMMFEWTLTWYWVPPE